MEITVETDDQLYMLTAQENVVSLVLGCGAAPFLIAASRPEQVQLCCLLST